MNKEFRIGDIFIKKTVRGIPKSEEDLTENVQGYHVFGQNIKYQYSYKVLWDDKYLTRVDSNYPILAYTSSVGEIGIITESFYRTGDNGAFQGLFPRTKIKLMAMLYILACLQKRFTVFDYSTSMANIVGLTLELPVIEHADSNHEYTVDDIDWQYMEDRIKELEEDRIKELDAYLKATNLDDYELTDEDEKVFALSSEFVSNEASSWASFLVREVLNVEQTKSVVAKSNLIFGDIPYVTRTVSDNGYMGKCGNLEKMNQGNCITIGAETGVAFYQPNDFVAGNKVYRLSRDGLGEKEYLFLASVLNMQTKNYSYSNARIPEKIKSEFISLPVIPHADPEHVYTVDDIDWKYMERYIRAIEKLTIADVVKYKDKVIDTTKMLVNSQS